MADVVNACLLFSNPVPGSRVALTYSNPVSKMLHSIMKLRCSEIQIGVVSAQRMLAGLKCFTSQHWDGDLVAVEDSPWEK